MGPMRLTVVGSADASNDCGRGHSCYWLEGATSAGLMVDFGATAVMGVKQLGHSPRDIGTLLFTHLHGDHIAGSRGIYAPEHPPRRFVLRLFSPSAAQLLRENPWHPSQRLEPEPGGTWRLCLELTTSRELISRVLALGPDAEVLEPEEFRGEIEGRIDASRRRYQARAAVARRACRKG